MSDTPYRGRFAPSPTGPLHAGSLYTAVASWLLARHHGGKWVIRIEDVDRDRCISGAAEHQLATLAGFGLVSDEPVIWQSRRDPHYQTALNRLLHTGDAFVCGCSRRQLADQGGLHHGCVAPVRPDGHNAVRLDTARSGRIQFHDGLQGDQQQDVASSVGDVVLLRADGCWAYQLAVVVDDAAQDITHVVRGADLLDSTARQIWLQQRLGLPTPHYLHLALLTDCHGRKLSKSDSAHPVDTDNALLWLRQVWGWLGQPASALENALTVADILETMQHHFRPNLLPKQLPPLPTMENP